MINKILNGRYQIVELIGRGGMAYVYKAKDLKLNRFVAVKVLREEYTDNEQFIKKFDRESQAAAGLSHPNIVSVYDVGVQDNIYYIIMEYVDGITLKQYLNKKGRQPEQVQDFYPTPGTISTCMYYTGIDPLSMKSVYVARSPREKDMQRALLQWKNPAKRALVAAALEEAGREDLIGFGPECLVHPMKTAQRKNTAPRPSEPEAPKPKKNQKRKTGWAKPKAKKSSRSGGKKKRP